jgi:hypothetical protein
MSNYKKAQECALLAAQAIIANPPGDEEVIFYDALFEMGSFPERPNNCTQDEHESWALLQLTFKETWKLEIIKALGRKAVTVRGEGYRLLPPNQSLVEAETRALEKALKAIQKGRFELRHIRDDLLSPKERQQKTDAQVRMASLEGAIRETARNPIHKPIPSSAGTRGTDPAHPTFNIPAKGSTP